MCENTYVFPEELCTLVQGILLALTPIGGNIFEFQGGKPNFAALVSSCLFVQAYPFPQQSFFFQNKH